MTRRFRLLCCAALTFGVSLGAACGDDVGFPPPGDQGPMPLDGRGTAEDLDGDGLCNVTEMAEGTDPLSPDTDSDGFDDLAERTFAYDPLEPSSPDRELVDVLRETTEGSVQVPIEVAVRGSGESYDGAFSSVDVVDLADQDASTFFRGAVATFAEPPDNVAAIDAEGQSFASVIGRTLLGFEVRFEYGEALTRGCVRGYPYTYTVKRSDGVRVAIVRRLLLVLPPGQTLESAAWCAPEGGCI